MECNTVCTEIVENRLNNFANNFLAKLVKYEMLSAFADPAVQTMFKDMQKVAICTDRELDYDMLSEMLTHRVCKDDDFVVKAAISKLINIIQFISDDSLSILTIIFIITSISPESGDVIKGLEVLDDLFSKFVDDDNELSELSSCLDNLLVLDIVNFIPFSKANSFVDILRQHLDGYFVDGIKFNSSDYHNAIDKLKAVGLSEKVLLPNPFLDSYVRIPVTKKDSIKDINLISCIDNNQVVSIKLNSQQIDVLTEIYDMYENNSRNKSVIIDKFNQVVSSYSNLNKVIVWWEKNISGKSSFELTIIGKVLAQVNAKRVDSRIPALNYK